MPRTPPRLRMKQATRWRDKATHMRPASRWNVSVSLRPESGWYTNMTCRSRPWNRSALAGRTERCEVELGVKRRLHELDGVGHQATGHRQLQPPDLWVAGYQRARAGHVRADRVADPALDLARDDGGDLAWIAHQH